MQDLIDIYLKTKGFYEKKYDIHLCSVEEIEDVVDFINVYWQSGHILTKSRELLNWQHYDAINKRYNFVVARERNTGEIHGICGFIISSIFDPNIREAIRWGAIWKVREDVASKGLGVAIKGFMELNVPSHFVGGVGLSKYSKKIDGKLGEYMGKLNQFYMANPHISEYKILVNPQIYRPTECNERIIFRDVCEEMFVDNISRLSEYIMPYKSGMYYVNRYFKHPIYRYKCVSVIEEGIIKAFVFYRISTVKMSNNLFIVDYVGSDKALALAYSQFVDLMDKENAECITFPCAGINGEILHGSGFLLRDDSDVIVPMYYEPFEQRNVELDYHFWPAYEHDKMILVKGDADQDRPNQLYNV